MCPAAAARRSAARRKPCCVRRRPHARGRGAQEYLAQLGTLNGVLGLRSRCDARTLGIRFGCLVCAPAAEHCLARCAARASICHVTCAR